MRVAILEDRGVEPGLRVEDWLVTGDVLEVRRIASRHGLEQVWYLLVDLEEVILPISIARADLEGDPSPGTRVSVNVWLQGFVVPAGGADDRGSERGAPRAKVQVLRRG